MLDNGDLLFAKLIVTILALSVVLLGLQAPVSCLLLQAIDLFRESVDLQTGLSVCREKV